VVSGLRYIHVTVIVTSTDDLLSTRDADAVLVLEEIGDDENTIVAHLGSTSIIVIPSF